MRPAVVIGIGNEFRHDDGVGLAVAAEIDDLGLPGVRVVLTDGEPVALLEAWTDAPLAIVIDAVICEPSTPGRIWRSSADDLPAGTGAVSSHALGIPDALRLGQALGTIPHELIVFAVEAADLSLGPGLSPEVAHASPALRRAVLAELVAFSGGRRVG